MKKMVAYQNALNKLLEIDLEQALFADTQAQQLLKHIDTNNKGLRILDVGCSDGFITYLFSTALPNAHIIGIDHSQEHIAFARQLAPHQNFIFGSIENAQLEQHTFDYVYSSLVLHHIPKTKQQQFITAINNLLKPGGTGIILELNPLHLHTRREFYSNPEEAGLTMISPWALRRAVTQHGTTQLSFYGHTPIVQSIFGRLTKKNPFGQLYSISWKKLQA